jgi:hypothetical protein
MKATLPSPQGIPALRNTLTEREILLSKHYNSYNNAVLINNNIERN